LLAFFDVLQLRETEKDGKRAIDGEGVVWAGGAIDQRHVAAEHVVAGRRGETVSAIKRDRSI